MTSPSDSSSSRGELIGALAARIQDAGARRVVVDGVDGAGKTTFADELGGALGEDAVRVSIDGFHNPRAVRYARGRDDPEGFYRDSYDYASFVASVLEPADAAVPAVFDHETDRRVVAEPVPLGPASILVVDGIFLHREELAHWWDFSIWLDVPFAISIPRGAARGAGFGSPDPAASSNRRYVEGQRLYLRECDPRSRATVVVDNSDLAFPRLLDAATLDG